MLFSFVRSCFLWMPFELYTLCSLAFGVFSIMFTVKVLKLVWDSLPFI